MLDRLQHEDEDDQKREFSGELVAIRDRGGLCLGSPDPAAWSDVSSDTSVDALSRRVR